jgi:beta-glucosidase
MTLPTIADDFLWGVAIASHQNEGGAPESDWTHAERQGRFPHACGEGTRFREHLEEDLDRVAKDLGCNAFRTSIEWARLEPRRGEWDAEEVAYLHRMFQAARARGLRIIATLHHFTSPRWIYDGLFATGWESRQTAEAFARYARFVASEFGRYIDFYLTFNEASNMVAGGYLAGRIPPFRYGPVSAVAAVRTILEAHRLAYEAIHEVQPEARVSFSEFTGVLPFPGAPLPWTPGRFLSMFQERSPGPDGRKRLAHMDFISLHYYGDIPFEELGRYPLRPYHFTAAPAPFGRILHRYWESYGLPILIGENGCATFNHAPRKDAWTAPRYMAAHVAEVQRAIAEGIPLLGYCWWTLTDNYEWGSFDARFGLYRVECREGDLTRHPTPAVDTYRRIIASGGVTPELAEDVGLTAG